MILEPATGRDPDFRVMGRALGPMNFLVFSVGSIFLLSSSSEAGVWPLRFVCTKKWRYPNLSIKIIHIFINVLL
jgi:hypothetical protein